MNDTNVPTQSKSTLIKASIAATVIAVFIYFTLILPAEYNQDPTGIGTALGLTQLSGNDGSSPESQLANDSSSSLNTAEQPVEESIDQIEIIVPAGRGLEYKFKMKQYGKLTFEWSTDGSPLYFDFHGEPEGDTTGYFESYSIATANDVKGSTTVPFDGVHGWYWKNKTDKEVVVTLITSGVYEVIGKPH